MKKNVLRVVIAVIIVIFTFSAGLWIGISFDSFKGYLFNANQNSASKDRGSILEEISGSITSKFSIKPIEEIIDLVSGSALVERSKEELLKAAIEGILLVLDDK
ncbi:MAG: hypothetical protein FJW63_04285, partial [Actinobacteria bacterium]|nr:hypothetical protein [Actinomycetota bacterium]